NPARRGMWATSQVIRSTLVEKRSPIQHTVPVRIPGRSGLEVGAAALAISALSLLRWGTSCDYIGLYLPRIHDLAGTWPAPPDAHLELLRNLPLWWCHAAAFFDARGALDPALTAVAPLIRLATALAALQLARSIGGRRARASGAFL